MKFNQAADASESQKQFFKLKDGQNVRVVFRGEPYEFKQHWINNRGVLCNGGSENCSPCREGMKPGFRFRVNLVMSENGVFVSKIWEQGWTVYNQLKDLNADYPLETHLVKVARTGSGAQDTTYSILPVPNGMLSQQQHEKISKVELQVLAHPAVAPHPAPAPAQAQSGQHRSAHASQAQEPDAFQMGGEMGAPAEDDDAFL